jgi:hypothetical protein
LNEYPEYDTQGKNLPELEAMLKSLYEDISSGELQGIRRKSNNWGMSASS